MIEPAHSSLSIRAQCELLAISTSSFYRKPAPVDPFDSELMKIIDQEYLKTPFYGVERMTWKLQQLGHRVNPKRIRRLMRLMALEAIYPKPRTSAGGAPATRYPYLVGGATVDAPDIVWATDITYIPLARGYCYLCAIIDWHTRYVIAWDLSTSMEALFCIDVLKQALATGRKPQILNSDQGSQFTCQDYVDRLLGAGIRPSWDGRGCWRDNVFVERLWRSVKYECVYLASWERPAEARAALASYFEFYNTERPHTALDKLPPVAVYSKTPKK
jgi:putative transposase